MKIFAVLACALATLMALAMGQFELDVVNCEEITEEAERYLARHLSGYLNRTATLTCGEPVPTAGSGGGMTYTRWGHNTCPDVASTRTIYPGVMAGPWYTHSGGGANLLCLSNSPDDGNLTVEYSSNANQIYGGEYENPIVGTDDTNVPCAVCYASARSAKLMIPAKTVCPSGWTREYYGYLMSPDDSYRRGEHVCVDQAQVAIPDSEGNTEGALLYHVQASCTGIQCPPYDSGKVLTCVVCSK